MKRSGKVEERGDDNCGTGFTAAAAGDGRPTVKARLHFGQRIRWPW
jgi:hypothetical protein